MTPEEHKKRHEELFKSLDELVADFIRHTCALPSKTNLMDFMTWASEQRDNPTEIES